MPFTYESWNSFSVISVEQVALGAASAQSGAAPLAARMARISPTGNCRVLSGSSNPTATAASIYVAAGAEFKLAVKPGWKIAVIQEGAATGNCSIAWCE